MNLPQSVCTFTCGWTFGLFPVFGYFEGYVPDPSATAEFKGINYFHGVVES